MNKSTIEHDARMKEFLIMEIEKNKESFFSFFEKLKNGNTGAVTIEEFGELLFIYKYLSMVE